jgi:hypothetical protein
VINNYLIFKVIFKSNFSLDKKSTQHYSCVMIPRFDTKGNLPRGIHLATWKEFAERFGTNLYRRRLLQGLKKAINSLQLAGCKSIYIDGSFITTKEIPADFDGCWDLEGVDISLLDPVLLDFDSGRLAQKAKYGGELFPAQFTENGSGKTFLEFFASDKETGDAKGIVAFDLQGEWE